MIDDTQERNRLIATFYNDDYSLQEIADKLLHHGYKVSKQTVAKVIKKLKDEGALDYAVPAERKEGEDELDDILGTKKSLFRIGVLDIETTGLWSDFGYILCAVIKDLDTGGHEVYRLDETPTMQDRKKLGDVKTWRRIDKELLEKLSEGIQKFDMLVHFNGRSFDIKFINTRLLKNGLPLLPPMKQLDIYQIARHRLRLRSKRLDALKSFLEVDDFEEGHRWEYWQMAGAGVKEGYDYVVEHCKRDVDRLAEVAIKMKNFIEFVAK